MAPTNFGAIVESDQNLESVKRLTRDLKAAAASLTASDARYLVDYYYAMQEDRIRAAHQARQASESEEPHEVIKWLGINTAVIENQVKRALDAYTDASPVGKWSKSIVGIGPVISSGLLAHIDITKAPTVGHIWRFAGLDPTSVWNKGEKRPWNARLKTLCWKIGESFVKVSGNEKDFYGKLYLERKIQEVSKNDAGDFAEQAAAMLKKFNYNKDTDAYAAYIEGRLPKQHIHARSKRWAVKLFLAHWHQVAYFHHYNTMPPKPYAIDHLHHAHEIVCPNWPF